MKGLRDADDGAVQAHRVDGHGRRGRDEGLPGRHRQRHPDGVPAPQHQGDRGLFHAGDELGDGQPRLDVAPNRVEEHQEPVHVVALLHRRQQGEHMFVFGGLGGGVQHLVPLDLADDGQCVNGPPFGADQRGAQILNLLPALLELLRSVLFHGYSSLIGLF